MQVTVPPNTQILEITYTAGDPVVAQQVANAVADGLPRQPRPALRGGQPGADRAGGDPQTLGVVEDLRAATAAAQTGTTAERLLPGELADALRNELVSLRAQRTALENSESPAGAGHLAGLAGARQPPTSPRLVHARRRCARRAGARLPDRRGPGAVPRRGPVGARTWRRLGCRSSPPSRRPSTARPGCCAPRRREAASTPPSAGCGPRCWTSTRGRTSSPSHRAGIGTLRRRRAEAVAESFAKAGHRVVLVRTDGDDQQGRRWGWRTEAWPRHCSTSGSTCSSCCSPASSRSSACSARRVHRREPRAARLRPRSRRALAAHRGRSPGRHPGTGHRQRRGRGVRGRRRPGPGRRDRRAGPGRATVEQVAKAHPGRERRTVTALVLGTRGVSRARAAAGAGRRLRAVRGRRSRKASTRRPSSAPSVTAAPAITPTTDHRGQLEKLARRGSASVVGAGFSAVFGVLLVVVVTNGFSPTVAGTLFAATSAVPDPGGRGPAGHRHRPRPVAAGPDRVRARRPTSPAPSWSRRCPVLVSSLGIAVALYVAAPALAPYLVGAEAADTMTDDAAGAGTGPARGRPARPGARRDPGRRAR